MSKVSFLAFLFASISQASIVAYKHQGKLYAVTDQGKTILGGVPNVSSYKVAQDLIAYKTDDLFAVVNSNGQSVVWGKASDYEVSH